MNDTNSGNCIWCGTWQKLDGLYTIYPIYLVGVYFHEPCHAEFMNTLISMARRENEKTKA